MTYLLFEHSVNISFLTVSDIEIQFIQKCCPKVSFGPQHNPQAALDFEDFLCQYADVIILLNA